MRVCLIRLGFLFLSIIGLNIVATGRAPAADLIIGAGSENAVHGHVSRGLCRTIGKSISGISCESKRIVGGDAAEPLAVLSDVANGAIEIGLVPTDWLYFAHKRIGPAKFLDMNFDVVRALFTLHGEPFTLVVRKDSGITKIGDLAGKRVNIGPPGSRSRTIMNLIMTAMGWTRKSFQLADELGPVEQSLALCHNRVQAVVLTTTHPDASLAKTLDICGATIVDVSGNEIDKLIASHPYLSTVKVPAGTYAGQAAPISTFGVRVAAITSIDSSADFAHSITGAVVDGMDQMKRLHPALRPLDTKSLLSVSGVVSLHDGAAQYFRDKGMM